MPSILNLTEIKPLVPDSEGKLPSPVKVGLHHGQNFWGLTATAGFLYRYLLLIPKCSEFSNVTAAMAFVLALSTAVTKLSLEVSSSELNSHKPAKIVLDTYGVFTTAGAIATFSIVAGMERAPAEIIGFSSASLLAFFKFSHENSGKPINVPKIMDRGINVFAQFATAGFVFAVIKLISDISENSEDELAAVGISLSIGFGWALLQAAREIIEYRHDLSKTAKEDDSDLKGLTQLFVNAG